VVIKLQRNETQSRHARALISWHTVLGHAPPLHLPVTVREHNVYIVTLINNTASFYRMTITQNGTWPSSDWCQVAKLFTVWPEHTDNMNLPSHSASSCDMVSLPKSNILTQDVTTTWSSSLHLGPHTGSSSKSHNRASIVTSIQFNHSQST
jgi:hypothetical protein